MWPVFVHPNIVEAHPRDDHTNLRHILVVVVVLVLVVVVVAPLSSGLSSGLCEEGEERRQETGTEGGGWH